MAKRYNVRVTKPWGSSTATSIKAGTPKVAAYRGIQGLFCRTSRGQRLYTDDQLRVGETLTVEITRLE